MREDLVEDALEERARVRGVVLEARVDDALNRRFLAALLLLDD